ncbi:MAG: T9SS type A sorting domain-containing protein [Phaeodactylibacter sp.]|nr:T9SS type A sorting domain-containing protein [Phaeodactylibacter sp.]MCB9301961.1 T9SS type A sorting domain-containing protein [Lewinellaceae bacterium]
MVTSFKPILFIGLALFMSCVLQAQVKLKLSLLPDQQTYLVSMIPEQSWDMPMNMVGSAQVVLQMQAGRPFLAGNINSLIPGVSWMDNAYVESPASSPEFDFVCFALNEMGTKNIPFQEGQETPLFSFINLEAGCVGLLELVENSDTHIQNIVRNDHINITQNITVLGARGNAFTGIADGLVDCTVVRAKSDASILSHLHVYPIPTTDALQISWETHPGQKVDQLLVSDFLGKLTLEQKVIPELGKQNLSLDVSGFPPGLYTASLVNTETGDRQFFQFIVVRI